MFDGRFSSTGSEILFRRIAEYELAENLEESKVLNAGERVFSFADLQRVADAREEIASAFTGPDRKVSPAAVYS